MAFPFNAHIHSNVTERLTFTIMNRKVQHLQKNLIMEDKTQKTT